MIPGPVALVTIPPDSHTLGVSYVNALLSGAMRALLRGGYEGAWDLLFSRPDVQITMGDEFPWEI